MPVVILSLLRGGVNAETNAAGSFIFLCSILLMIVVELLLLQKAPMSDVPHLAIEGVRKLYGEVAALDDVSLSVGGQDYVVLLGPSGSGKTTLLSVIGGFVFPTAGRVRIAGRDVTDSGRRCGRRRRCSRTTPCFPICRWSAISASA